MTIKDVKAKMEDSLLNITGVPRPRLNGSPTTLPFHNHCTDLLYGHTAREWSAVIGHGGPPITNLPYECHCRLSIIGPFTALLHCHNFFGVALRLPKGPAIPVQTNACAEKSDMIAHRAYNPYPVLLADQISLIFEYRLSQILIG